MVPLHLHLPTSDRQHLEAQDLWRAALHGPTQNGRNVDLGHLRKLVHGRFDSPNPFHHRPEDDERSPKISFSGAGSLHLQSRVSYIQT
jgi:hypothetical protein